MTAPFGQFAFTLGEVAPRLFGRADLARFHVAASTMRNWVVAFTGGAFTRAGFKFVGYSKQTGRSYPPRLLPFQFNINQGIVLEFGHQYMRVIENGAYVTEAAFSITGISLTDPATVTIAPAQGVNAASPNVAAVYSTYAPGDTVTLAGGAPITPAVLEVVETQLVSLAINAAGLGYAPGDTVTLAGGTASTPAQVTVAGVGGGGAILSFTINTPGTYTVNPTGAAFTQAATSGGGAGATFRFAVMGPRTLSVQTAGIYPTALVNPVSQEESSSTGLGATFTVGMAAVAALQEGDWVELASVGGMPQLSNGTFVAVNVGIDTFQIRDVFGNDIDATGYGAYTGGGTAARIYTITTPYNEEDLSYLKFTQSKDVLSLCLLNQITLVEYPTYDLERLGNANWSLVELQTATSVEAPTNLAGTASGAGGTTYQYVVTAVDPEDGSESVASNIATVAAAVNIAATAGTIRLTWSPVEGVKQYNVYKASPTFSGSPPVGALFGYAGSAYGPEFTDSNIIADFTQVPPRHANPFARGQILGGSVITGGAAYTTVGFTINTTTGTGASLVGVILSGALNAIIVQDPGEGYAPGDTVTVTGDGTGATARLEIGPQEGTYPSTVSYFQQRRVYANTLNRPDTYFMSQPAAFENFDGRIPTIDTDAIIGNPWSMQMNGIQALMQMPGGLVALTGRAAWQLTGSGGSSFNPQPITPSSQDAQQQAFNGCHDHILPTQIEGDILYVQSKGAIVRNLSYNFYQNIYSGADMTLNSVHLFQGYQLVDSAWTEEPFKVMWYPRDDGVLLSLTYVKAQEVAGWARHDTQGLFQTVCSVTELQNDVHDPNQNRVDALYASVKRFAPLGQCYMVERMDDRIWASAEEAWCVDAGLTTEHATQNATLSVSSARGLGTISSVSVLAGGSGYSASTTLFVVDQEPGSTASGAALAPTIAGGIITGATVSAGGTGYIRPMIVVSDPAGSAGGSGASLEAALNNTATFTTDVAAFGSAAAGDVIRAGGGIATITSITSTTEVQAQVTQPIVALIPNTDDVAPQPGGSWTMARPQTTFYGARHLTGYEITGLYDGKVFTATVDTDGAFDTPEPATHVIAGLAFTPQLQSIYLDTSTQPTVQGQRKSFPAVVVRVEQTRGLKIGTNQPDGSTLSPQEIAPVWSNMNDLPAGGVPVYGSDVVPLFTGDIPHKLQGGFDAHGQIAIQQDEPLPATILALITDLLPGDIPEVGDARSRER